MGWIVALVLVGLAAVTPALYGAARGRLGLGLLLGALPPVAAVAGWTLLIQVAIYVHEPGNPKSTAVMVWGTAACVAAAWLVAVVGVGAIAHSQRRDERPVRPGRRRPWRD